MNELTRAGPGRVLAVTAGVSLLGALAGGVAGVAFMAGIGIIFGDLRFQIGTYLVPGGLGALLGLVLGPILAWTLLRSVPLWRAALETALGAAIGAGLGMFYVPWGFFGGAIGGAVLAAVLLRVRYSRRERR